MKVKSKCETQQAIDHKHNSSIQPHIEHNIWIKIISIFI